MAPNTVTPASIWTVTVAELRARRCTYRLKARARSPYITVRQLRDGVAIDEFSIAPLRVDREDHLTIARDLCLKAHEQGRWLLGPDELQARFADYEAIKPNEVVFELTWAELAEKVAANVCQRIVKEGSRVHTLNHLRNEIAKFPGPVSPDRLELWAMEKDPTTQRSAFTKRLDTLSQIDKSGLMHLLPVVERLRRLRPTGAAERLRKTQSMRVRVIPTDEQIEEWLLTLQPFDRWLYGCLATWGLRPHELWHAHCPDERGWLTVPGEGLETKTHTHHVPPVPSAWVERFGLREHWAENQQRLRDRWKIRHQEVNGLPVPVNNHQLGQYLYKQFTLRDTPRLFAALAEGEGTDWVRPYDLRHSYAIRCAVHPETAHAFDEDMAEWMGHGIDVHQRTYLRWLPASRKKESMQRRFASPDEAAAAPAAPDDAEIAAKLARLEVLEAQLAALKGLL